MKLSDGEKLIAFMLADIMEAGGIKGDIDPAFIKTVVAEDDLWALRWKYGGFFHNEGPSDDIVDETTKIMTMCRVVENSIGQLAEEERTTIPERDRQIFVGFDGNEEPHYGVAKMLVEHLDRYSEWMDRDLNSHHNTLDGYLNMKQVFDELDWSSRGALDLEGIRAVIEARSK